MDDDREKFKRLQELIKEDKVLIETSRTLCTTIGGQTVGCLSALIIISVIIGIIILLAKGLFLYTLLVIISFGLFLWLYRKITFYFCYIRSITNFDFFNSAYVSGVIRLRSEEGVVSYPTPWTTIFELDKWKKNGFQNAQESI